MIGWETCLLQLIYYKYDVVTIMAGMIESEQRKWAGWLNLFSNEHCMRQP